MATITITVDTGAGTVSRVKTIAGPALTRLIAAFRSSFGQVPTGAPVDPVTGILPMRDRTDPEVLQAWADHLMEYSRNVTLSQERNTALAGVVPIVVT